MPKTSATSSLHYIENLMQTRNPMAILRQIDALQKETRLTPAYKEQALAALTQELFEAQGQLAIPMPPQTPTKGAK